MKHVIEVPAGHTVQISRRGNRVTVESAESRDQLSPVGGIKLAGAPAATEEVIKIDVVIPKVPEPGTVLVWAYRKPFTENEKIREFIVYGADGKQSCLLTSDKELRLNTEGYHPEKLGIGAPRIATPAEREEFLSNLRDWYGLMITESGELVNWRANNREEYMYISWVADAECGREVGHQLDDEVYNLGNYFPEGFLTDERLTEYKATVQKLFNKWRGLCSE